MRRRFASAAWLVVGTGLMTSCIAYDREIRVVSEYYNESPVRIVESTYISAEADAACDAESELANGAANEAGVGCAKPQQYSQVPHFLDPTQYRFCRCSSQARRDPEALPAFDLFVEDNDPADEVRAVIILDIDPSGRIPPNTTIYQDYVDPNAPLELDLANQYADRLLNRSTPTVHKLSLGRTEEGFDLCNGRYGTNASALTPGWHTITILVTDRKWFEEKAENSRQQYGVPDLSRGATHDSVTYSFYCNSEDAAQTDENACTCESRDSGER